MKDKVVVITGATSGIGKALAYEYSLKGSFVVICGRNLEKLQEIASDIESKNGEISFLQTDVSIESECKSLIDTAISKYGKIDVLINNAGISMRANFETTDLLVIKRVMDVNFWGTVYCTKYALPYIIKEKGSIVGISSVAGITGLPGRSGYSASKFAINGFLQCVRTENLKKDLHVLVAYPGFTATDIRRRSLTANGSPQGESPRIEEKMMKPEEVAEHIYKAVRKRKKNIVLTAEGKVTSLLNKFFPEKIDNIIYKVMSREPDSPFK
ncbi:MAG TPA: SDR family oxidoreductase [Bacteroidales bacterium]